MLRNTRVGQHNLRISSFSISFSWVFNLKFCQWRGQPTVVYRHENGPTIWKLLLRPPIRSQNFPNSLCDNWLTFVTRAWPLRRIYTKPLLVTPAMSTVHTHVAAYRNHNVSSIVSSVWYLTLIPPISKTLTRADDDISAMKEVLKIVRYILDIHPQGTIDYTSQSIRCMNVDKMKQMWGNLTNSATNARS